MSGAAWRTSSHSNGHSACVQVARLPGEVRVRDSKDPRGPALAFTLTEWAEFIAGLKRDPAALAPWRAQPQWPLRPGLLDLPECARPPELRDHVPRPARRLPPPFVDEDPPI